MNITDLMNELVIARHNTQSAYQVYKACKETEDEIREDLMSELRKTGLKAAKDADTGNSVSIAKREQIKVTNEAEVIAWLEENPSVQAKDYIGLRKTSFDPIAKAWLEKTGEIIPGTELVDNEYLTIKEKK